MNEIFVFKRKDKNHERPLLLAIPKNKINTIESQWGSQSVYCVVNGIEVDCSFTELLNEFEKVIDFSNLGGLISNKERS